MTVWVNFSLVFLFYFILFLVQSISSCELARGFLFCSLGECEDIQEMEKAGSKNGDHEWRNGGYLLTGHMMCCVHRFFTKRISPTLSTQLFLTTSCTRLYIILMMVTHQLLTFKLISGNKDLVVDSSEADSKLSLLCSSGSLLTSLLRSSLRLILSLDARFFNIITSTFDRHQRTYTTRLPSPIATMSYTPSPSLSVDCSSTTTTLIHNPHRHRCETIMVVNIPQ